jgi:hypothetical protein
VIDDKDETCCCECGYLLRGLAPTGNCPECNTAISRSLELGPHFRERRHVRRRAILYLALVCIAVAAYAYNISWRPGSNNLSWENQFRDSVFHIAPAVLGVMLATGLTWSVVSRMARRSILLWVAITINLLVEIFAILLWLPP